MGREDSSLRKKERKSQRSVQLADSIASLAGDQADPVGRNSPESTGATMSGEGNRRSAQPRGKEVLTLSEDGPAKFLNVFLGEEE